MHRREERRRVVEFPLDVTSGRRFSIVDEAIIRRGLLFVEQAHNKKISGFHGGSVLF